MADSTSKYYGVSFNNIRKALFLLYFGHRNGECDDFNTPLYKYIIPMQGNFDDPLQLKEKDTYILYWIERDDALTQDDYVIEEGKGYNRQKCVATVLMRFAGKEAETWAKALRHLVKRKNVTPIWSGVCNAERLPYVYPIIPVRVDYFGKNSQIAFDVRMKLYYDEVISTGWQPLEGIDFTVEGKLTVEDSNKEDIDL